MLSGVSTPIMFRTTEGAVLPRRVFKKAKARRRLQKENTLTPGTAPSGKGMDAHEAALFLAGSISSAWWGIWRSDSCCAFWRTTPAHLRLLPLALAAVVAVVLLEVAQRQTATGV